MGTSTSSSGPGSGVPLVPPWVTDAESDSTGSSGADMGIAPEEIGVPDHEGQSPQQQQPQPQLAATGRFRSARRNLGDYSRTGDHESLKKGLGHYSRSGLGGSRQATARMVRTAKNSGLLYNALNALSGRGLAPSGLDLDLRSLSGQSAQEIADRLAQAISPSDGSQDAEANRDSISEALRDLIKENPDVDVTALTEEQVTSIVESYIGYDICRRIDLDVGQAIFDKTDPVTAIRRQGEMLSYVKQCVASAFRGIRSRAKSLSRHEASRIAREVIQKTFDVFEEYIL